MSNPVNSINDLMALLPGDVICCAGQGSWFNNLTTWLALHRGANPNDAAVAHISGKAERALLVEENFKGLKIVSVTALVDRPIRVYRRIGISDEQRQQIVDTILPNVGDGYGLGKDFLDMLDCLGRTYWFTQHWGFTHWKQCACLWGWAIHTALTVSDAVFGVPWRSLQPYIVSAYCRQHPDEWELVYATLQEPILDATTSFPPAFTAAEIKALNRGWRA